MSKGYIATVFLFTLIHSYSSYINKCDYTCDTYGCQTSINTSYDNAMFLKFCNAEDIPNDVHFSVIEYENETSKFPAILQMNFKPPRRRCKYDITLLANESPNEKKCIYYNFKNQNGLETHSRSTVCFVSDNNRYQDTIASISFPYIFTACYSVQFFFGKNVKKIRTNKLIKTNYKHLEITKPTMECSYDVIPANMKDKVQVVLEMSFSVPIVTSVMIYIGSLHNFYGDETCNLDNEDLANGFRSFNVLGNYIENKSHHHLNTSLFKNGMYKGYWKFKTDILWKGGYCFGISLSDDVRCRESTLWNPPVRRCTWYGSCRNITIYKYFAVETKNDNDPVSYLYLPIIIITLSIFAFVVIMYIIYAIHVCNVQGQKFSIKAWNGNIIGLVHNKYNRGKTNALKDKQNVRCKDVNITNTDVVLLYPKGSESFMTLMADFRRIINRVCGCVVHDWYDSMEWNYVAEIGASDWFAEMLHNESRVIWIDIPTMRSLIAQRFQRNSFLKEAEESSIANIGDFRDVVFPTVFSLAKSNMEQYGSPQTKHFIVRLKEFEHFENNNDPFKDLSPHMRYCIPQDLNLLCSDLSTLESDIIVPSTIQEEELIKQHLRYVKFDFCK